MSIILLQDLKLVFSVLLITITIIILYLLIGWNQLNFGGNIWFILKINYNCRRMEYFSNIIEMRVMLT